MKHGKRSRLLSKKTEKNSKSHYSAKARSRQFIDLSDFEETADRSFFQNVGQTAAKNAVNENKAMRIPITFLQDGWIVRRMPTGDIQKIFEVAASYKTFKRRRIAKGTILHANRSAC
ncbi:hypothetical protein [Paraflavitalea speifideaquila]|uniref:hypothetical protein n=1 Tax=Paraflavitalea speifideaquila TaxID=3076558 RepID=UPI0028EF80DA|nr:hypothetical protein [Paraflavitalea speifideiaquila]